MRRENSSLPLMGIGNVLRVDLCRRHAQLITPHGDRKQQCVSHYRSISLISLPLMGIGNLHRERPPSRGVVVLITPHGDRKRACLSIRQPGLFTHYPSWGSETTTHERRTDMELVSLPLMGIGNGRERLRWCPRLRLITPHGDRKPWEVRGPGCRQGLITPHGDRKRGCS